MSYFGRRKINLQTRELKILLEASLSRLEKEIFLSLASFEGMTFSSAVKQLSYPESTSKSVIRKLKAKQLIECGSKSNTNVPLFLTDFGRKILAVLDNRWLQKLFWKF